MDIADRVRQGLEWGKRLLRRPEPMVFLPALTLAAYWLGGEVVLLAVALGLPLLFLTVGAFRFGPARLTPPTDGADGLVLRPQLLARLEDLLCDRAASGRLTGCLVLRIDEAETLEARHGKTARAELLGRCAERLCGALREGDMVARLEDGTFAVALKPQRRLDLESVIQISTRLQAALAAPISLDSARLYLTCSVGFCLGDLAPAPGGQALIDAAEVAAEEAVRNGPSAIRSHAPDMARRRAGRDLLRQTLIAALDDGQIHAHFQPQIATATGAITGFEALARWHHPERGVVPPIEFLPAIEEAGLAARLGEVMLGQALAALRRWNRAGLHVPCVSVNFSAAELADPQLVARLEWELGRLDLTPERLCVEILETVVASTENDVIARNIAALARLGCGIDLDDFGTGHAAIANIRRFSVRRLKIDRSFVTHVDTDPEQQRMVAAIQSLAAQLGLDTVAEGVETPGELARLTELGCAHVQGFGIARPMPFEQTPDWIAAHPHPLRAAPPAARNGPWRSGAGKTA
ncbi:MAG: bifunctional diguanylate cyclase/phosphodiesterase [Gemmobacter sp.]|jgi:EAL domain-containing protein (putative c-di-GMP-specific phosphodiesterase class I)/GGDEF domain-containing protein|nr:bifunctional diguanylate cyclase/phosphodiesterase [Gemmobacter sp.]